VYISLVSLVFSSTCQISGNKKTESLVNIAHLSHLSESLIIDNLEMTIVHIYADFPDYQWTPAPGEGFTCVDDVARSIIFYLNYYQGNHQSQILNETKKLLNFILYMQADNGLFYNFLLPDSSINKNHINSESRPDWWSWRAIWALAEAHQYYEAKDPDFAISLIASIERTLPAIDSILTKYPETREEEEGIKLPTWLPYQKAADQAAVMIHALIPYYKITENPAVKKYIQELADGLQVMQVGDSLQFPHGCFLSWRNKWHAYGNSQAHALLLAGELLEKSEYIESALKEINYFYPYLIKNQYLNEFTISRSGDGYEVLEKKSFSQIAYGIRPMVWACLKAADLTGKSNYSKLAGEITCWLFGKNVTGHSLYFPQSGRCFDGINDKDNLNKNSGAESTIEALLTLQAAEKDSIARQIIWDYYNK
jgi:hypothetical protein